MSATASIYDALEALVRVQEKLAITTPVRAAVAKAWPLFPPQSTTSAIATPCFLNEWSLIRETHGIDFPQDAYTIHSQLLVKDADLSQAARIATAFMPVFLAALWQRDGDGDGGVSLGGTVDSLAVRGGQPTLARIERAEGIYMGLDLLIDVQLSSAVATS